mmetsp:Transcript_10316/g.30619  ORF Transcript_10316/g.30619 Transcript_10316/m.30619 type:complete len:226 (+) Transcript_10316:1706-2383(+)
MPSMPCLPPTLSHSWTATRAASTWSPTSNPAAGCSSWPSPPPCAPAGRSCSAARRRSIASARSSLSPPRAPRRRRRRCRRYPGARPVVRWGGVASLPPPSTPPRPPHPGRRGGSPWRTRDTRSICSRPSPCTSPRRRLAKTVKALAARARAAARPASPAAATGLLIRSRLAPSWSRTHKRCTRQCFTPPLKKVSMRLAVTQGAIRTAFAAPMPSRVKLSPALSGG